MSYTRIPITNLLEQLDSQIAKKLIVVIAKGVISSLKEESLTILDSEQLIFNLDVLIYCKTHIQDEELYNLISYGMELEDIENLIKRSEVLVSAYNEIEQRLSKISYKSQGFTE